MEQNERKKYSREFKLEALRQTDLGKSVAEVARQLEIPVHQLYKWRSELDRKQSENLCREKTKNLPHRSSPSAREVARSPIRFSLGRRVARS